MKRAIACSEGGKNAHPELCKIDKIKGFPTWIIQGKQYPSTTTLQKLAEISNYKGSREFKNFPTHPNKRFGFLRDSIFRFCSIVILKTVRK
ncbi:hypothetical protein CK510_16605 [Brunnivagina elsteri CCALA 953]|uniref:Thioredoxin-like fold domain-containing protein n=1 Tax=Brunnivagina elsteri CCALA 953 TaxID=987040 RepID=A0A2A2TGS2_9CYAN|nr:hypothetical protein CK510_16605 [Calothrix elsteri CCALA 953]